MGIRYSDEWGAWELAKVRYGKKQGKYVEYVLSQKEWDELQARIEELEAKNARFKKALQKISGASVEDPARIFVRMLAIEALKATDEGTHDDG